MTIHDRIFIYKATIKNRKRDLIMGGLLLLATTLSFAIGYGAGQNTHRTPIVITQCELTQASVSR